VDIPRTRRADAAYLAHPIAQPFITKGIRETLRVPPSRRRFAGARESNDGAGLKESAGEARARERAGPCSEMLGPAPDDRARCVLATEIAAGVTKEGAFERHGRRGDPVPCGAPRLDSTPEFIEISSTCGSRFAGRSGCGPGPPPVEILGVRRNV
jgi:hypothetical protein